MDHAHHFRAHQFRALGITGTFQDGHLCVAVCEYNSDTRHVAICHTKPHSMDTTTLLSCHCTQKTLVLCAHAACCRLRTAANMCLLVAPSITLLLMCLLQHCTGTGLRCSTQPQYSCWSHCHAIMGNRGRLTDTCCTSTLPTPPHSVPRSVLQGQPPHISQGYGHLHKEACHGASNRQPQKLCLITPESLLLHLNQQEVSPLASSLQVQLCAAVTGPSDLSSIPGGQGQVIIDLQAACRVTQDMSWRRQ
jgi:hypothetical protein